MSSDFWFASRHRDLPSLFVLGLFIAARYVAPAVVDLGNATGGNP
jgi:hypothetical protein